MSVLQFEVSAQMREASGLMADFEFVRNLGVQALRGDIFMTLPSTVTVTVAELCPMLRGRELYRWGWPWKSGLALNFPDDYTCLFHALCNIS